jgi:hypothetical protein
VIRLAAPLSVIEAPTAREAGARVPEIVNVEVTIGVAVKFIPDILAPFTETEKVAGVNAYPDLLALTV